jgi:hypothetical protein
MAFPLGKVLADQRDILLFRPFKPDLKQHRLAYFAWGLFVTWLAGLGRYWDHPNAEPWQYAGLGSLAYVFVLAIVLWAMVAPLYPRNWSYSNVLIFVMLTSLPAVLYAIPVEKFLSPAAAQTANVIFLAIVAGWRVALLFAFLKHAGGLNGSRAFVATFLPLAGIVTALTVLNLEKAVFDIMGGGHESTANDAAYMILFLITVLSVIASPFLLIAYLVAAHHARAEAKAAAV